MNTDTIETIVTASRCKSFLEVARALNYSPSVISKRIAHAEEELGVRLFRRGNRSNSIAPTPECRVLLSNLEKIWKLWDEVSTTAAVLSGSDYQSVLRLGCVHQRWSYKEDEIIAAFIADNPFVSIEQSVGYSQDLLRDLRLGKLDIVSLVVQGDPGSSLFFDDLEKEGLYDFYQIDRVPDMYLAISSTSPLAKKKEATFDEFKDYAIAFNSDKSALHSRSNMQPFIALSEKYGFELKTTSMNTSERSRFSLATMQPIAIPSPNNDMNYPGISYVRLTDWPTCLSVYFVTLRGASSTLLGLFLDKVHEMTPEFPRTDVTLDVL